MEVSYKHLEQVHNTKAAEVVVPLILQMFPSKSILDVGCGIGTWLKVFKDLHGISDILGIDGNNVDPLQLLIPADSFQVHDLRSPFDLARRFDLVLCLEVAEHLDESCASMLIESLCRHADSVVFSAAIPGQGGQNHVNEQWPHYWQKKFALHGYTRVDALRHLIWDNAAVDIWYRQNIYVYMKGHSHLIEDAVTIVGADIHPELWEAKIAALEVLRQEVNNFEKGGAGMERSLKALINAIKSKF